MARYYEDSQGNYCPLVIHGESRTETKIIGRPFMESLVFCDHDK